MSKVIADQSMALDGFSTGPNVGVGNGMGDRGDQLHGWMFSDGAGAGVNDDVREDTSLTTCARTPRSTSSSNRAPWW
jgi:hypothetical protein